jgi:hypothetical protein
MRALVATVPAARGELQAGDIIAEVIARQEPLPMDRLGDTGRAKAWVATSPVAKAPRHVTDPGSSIGRLHEKGDSMAEAAAGGGAESSVADELRRLGVKGVLMKMAERGQLLDLKCEMPQCYHHKGRAAFDPVAKTRTKWAPSPDHYPTLKSAGGQLRPENVRLSHTECNQRDYTRRRQIGTLLAKGMSLAEIAETLNRRNVLPAHGTNQWTAAMVRKAYVS